MSPRNLRCNLLLDKMLPRKEKFPLLNNFHNVIHITHDCKKSGISDTEIVIFAKKQKRIVVTKNIKHFRKLCQQEKVDLIGATEIAVPEALDKSIMAYLRRKKVARMTGAFKNITKAKRK